MISPMSAVSGSPSHLRVVTPDPVQSSRTSCHADSNSDSPPHSSEATSKSSSPSSRRRHIDPTTCERDYSADEVEFMQALDHYKRTHGRMFPTCSEILEVLRGLGYSKTADERAGQPTP